MSKKTSFFLAIVLVVGMALYLGADTANYDTTLTFFETFLDNSQKYLYIVTLFLLPVLYCVNVPFLEPAYRVRLKDTLFVFTFKRALLASLLLTVLIVCSYLVAPLFFGKPFVMSFYYAFVFMRLFFFVLGAFALHNAVYFLTQKMMLSIFSVLISNMLFLVILISANYYILNGTISAQTQLVFLSFYNFALISLSVGLFLFQGEKKECLT